MSAADGSDHVNREAAIRQSLADYFDSLNRERWERLVSLFSEHGELRAVAAKPRRGRAEVGAYFRQALSPYSEHRDEPTRTIIAGTTATVEIRFEGRLANGCALGFDAVDIFDFEGDRIRRLTSWYDSARVLRALTAAADAEDPRYAE